MIPEHSIKNSNISLLSEERFLIFEGHKPRSAPLDDWMDENFEIDLCVHCNKKVDKDAVLLVDISPHIEYMRKRKFRVCSKCVLKHYGNKITIKKGGDINSKNKSNQRSL